ncbi:MAG TPA: hypothetical protein VHY20_07665, partial [Pirellulales bacterium]|nr:hypothetical protein [Pirellulales bacterium]
MPVQFYCPHCRQLLKVGRRKIGSLVACPRCGAPTMVPTAEGGSTPIAEESIAGFDDVNVLLRQSPMMTPPPATAAPAGWSSGGVQPSSPTRIAISADAHSSDMLLVSRT